MRRVIFLIFAVALVAGCSTYNLLEPRLVTIAGIYTVDPQIAWSVATQRKWELWTVDGPALQSVQFVKGLSDGESLFEEPAFLRRDEKLPGFRQSMSASEVMELVTDSFVYRGNQKVQGMNLRPQRFGGTEGFRFDMKYLTRAGLEKLATVAGAVIDGRLHLIIYSGAARHYYDRHRDDAERIMRSIRPR
jgi:hypothetical protein